MVALNPLGLIVIIPGLIAIIWPYKISRINEMIDAIGSKRSSSEVEPARWRVVLTRIAGVIVVFLGIILLVN